MTNELNQFEETIEKTKDQVVETAKRATTELDKRTKRLRKEIDEAGTRAKRTGLELQKRTEEFADSTFGWARDEFKTRTRDLEKLVKSARKDIDRFWSDIEVVLDDLVSARNNLAHALRIDKALASVQRELKRKPHEEREARKKAARKAPVRKTAAKKAPARKKAAKKTTTTKPSVKKAA